MCKNYNILKVDNQKQKRDVVVERFRDALITSSINCGTSFLSGFVIFSVLGYMAQRSGQDIDKVATEGSVVWGKKVYNYRGLQCTKTIVTGQSISQY